MVNHCDFVPSRVVKRAPAKALIYGYLPFSFFFTISLSAVFTLRSSFLMSSSGGNCSGLMPLLPKRDFTSVLFFTCSLVIVFSPLMLFCFTLKLVISVASSWR